MDAVLLFIRVVGAFGGAMERAQRAYGMLGRLFPREH